MSDEKETLQDRVSQLSRETGMHLVLISVQGKDGMPMDNPSDLGRFNFTVAGRGTDMNWLGMVLFETLKAVAKKNGGKLSVLPNTLGQANLGIATVRELLQELGLRGQTHAENVFEPYRPAWEKLEAAANVQVDSLPTEVLNCKGAE